MEEKEKTTVKARVAKTRKRIPLGTSHRLAVSNEIPGFKTRLVNDTPGRIARFMDAGYEPVSTDEATIGTSRANVGSPEGSINRIDVGGGLHAVLMKIPNEFYEEDQAAKMKRVDASEDTLKKPALEGGYGSVTITR